MVLKGAAALSKEIGHRQATMTVEVAQSAQTRYSLHLQATEFAFKKNKVFLLFLQRSQDQPHQRVHHPEEHMHTHRRRHSPVTDI